jgi:transposase InsO family protein
VRGPGDRAFLVLRLACRPRRAERAGADAELAERIRVVHGRDRTQGAPRITAELNDGAPPVARVSHKRVARVMCEHGVTGLRLRRRVRTTVPEPADQNVPDLSALRPFGASVSRGRSSRASPPACSSNGQAKEAMASSG